jgi:hypothetical protein
MTAKLNVPLDKLTVDGLRALGADIVKNTKKREAFLADPKAVLKAYGITGIDPNRLDKSVVAMLCDPKFEKAIETKDIKGIREFVHQSLGDRTKLGLNQGTFDFDFDVEVEVEVVAVAVAVFDFAVVQTKVPDIAELQRRRLIVEQAFEALGKKIPK